MHGASIGLRQLLQAGREVSNDERQSKCDGCAKAERDAESPGFGECADGEIAKRREAKESQGIQAEHATAHFIGDARL